MVRNPPKWRDQSALRKLSHQADTDVVTGVLRWEARSIGRRHEFRDVVPRAAADSAAAAIFVVALRTIGWSALVVLPETIQYPLPNISIHVVQAKPIGCERFYWRGLFVELGSTVAAIGAVLARCVAPPIARARASACGILPLGLTRQPINIASPLT